MVSASNRFTTIGAFIMAGEGYLFSKDLTQRTVNTIKKVSGTVTRASVPPARSRRGGGSKATDQNVFPIKITGGSNGVYSGKKIDPATGEPSSETIHIFANRATAYDLSSPKYTIGMIVAIKTMA